jgi:hypothetical protein
LRGQSARRTPSDAAAIAHHLPQRTVCINLRSVSELCLTGFDAHRSVDGLKELLNEYKLHAGLSISWVLFGPSGRETRPSEGGVLKDYEKCYVPRQVAIKTIVNSHFLEGVTVHPHNFMYRCAFDDTAHCEAATSARCSALVATAAAACTVVWGHVIAADVCDNHQAAGIEAHARHVCLLVLTSHYNQHSVNVILACMQGAAKECV